MPSVNDSIELRRQNPKSEVGKSSKQYNIYTGLYPAKCMEEPVTFGSGDKNEVTNRRTGSKSVYKTNTLCPPELHTARTSPLSP